MDKIDYFFMINSKTDFFSAAVTHEGCKPGNNFKTSGVPGVQLDLDVG